MDPDQYYGDPASWDLLEYLNSVEDGVRNTEHLIALGDVSGHGQVERRNEDAEKK